MGRLDDYRSALLAADAAVPDEALDGVLESAGPQFDLFVIEHGLGPLWHARTERPEFRHSRLAAEALFMAQQRAVQQIDSLFETEGIEYAVIKGAANRLANYDAPALRACLDIDLLVRPEHRIDAVLALAGNGFEPQPIARSISREVVMSRNDADIDLHWGLLREGRLRREDVNTMLDRRERAHGIWMLHPDDELFLLLVHAAFAKHLGGWDMGLHRVRDIVVFLKVREYDWAAVCAALSMNGVATAAWATLRWVQILTDPQPVPNLDDMLAALQPGPLRRRWIELWLRQNLSARMSAMHPARLLGFTTFLHDKPGDGLRAFTGRWRARRRADEDLAAFRELIG